MKTRIKQSAEVAAMRKSGEILANVLAAVAAAVRPGVTTKSLAEVAAAELSLQGGQPAFLGYQGYPDIICISVNDEIVHGIPGQKTLKNGDIVGLDFGVIYDGLITDGAITVPVGKISGEAEKLLRITRQALGVGIDAVRPGARVGDIGAAIEGVLRSAGLGVIEDLMGHGVGHYLHEEPGIPNFGLAGTGPILRAGMTIAIEPMATLGGKDIVISNDGWTISTVDGSLGAQFEHTVLVTENGAEILTLVS